MWSDRDLEEQYMPDHLLNHHMGLKPPHENGGGVVDLGHQQRQAGSSLDHMVESNRLMSGDPMLAHLGDQVETVTVHTHTHTTLRQWLGQVARHIGSSPALSPRPSPHPTISYVSLPRSHLSPLAHVYLRPNSFLHVQPYELPSLPPTIHCIHIQPECRILTHEISLTGRDTQNQAHKYFLFKFLSLSLVMLSFL